MEDAAYYEERYRWHKEHGYCVYCRKNKARKGKVACQECADKMEERRQKKLSMIPIAEKERKRIEKKKRLRQYYYEHKAKGICVHCKKPAIKGEVLCLECKMKDKALYQKTKKLKEITERREGFCYKHPDRPTVNGSKMCADCYEKAVRSVAIARENSPFNKITPSTFGRKSWK